jgi:uncharacterized protein (DUF849 family)
LACAKRLSNSEQQLHMSMASNPTLEPVALAVAPNGGRRGKSDHPALPITPAEVARTAAQCAEAGAAMIHLHVRDRYGRHVLDADAYRAATDAIHREAGSEIVVQITSERSAAMHRWSRWVWCAPPGRRRSR